MTRVNRKQNYRKQHRQRRTYTPTSAFSTKNAVRISSIVMFFDGGTFRSNPGNGGCGAVIVDRSESKPVVLAELSRPLGWCSNNVAEYNGLILGLEWLVEHQIPDVTVFGDSMLIIQQIQGNWKINHVGFQELYRHAWKLATAVPQINFVHVPRRFNSKADALASKACQEESMGVVDPIART